MNIFLLSCTDNLEPNLERTLGNEIRKRDNKVAYISSEPQVAPRPYYLSTIDDFSKISEGSEVHYFDLSSDFSDESLEEMLNYGTIYLSGGNTYIFLNDARKRSLYKILRKHLNNGGLLVGASAGALMMTPTIDLADGFDENIFGLTDVKGFHFVDFEFHPHFDESHIPFLNTYMEGKDTTLYVCKDGAGVFCGDDGVQLFGEVSEFIKKN
jgi:dipeptidase E